MVSQAVENIPDPIVRRQAAKCERDYHEASRIHKDISKCNLCNPNRNMSYEYADACYKNADVIKSCRKYLFKKLRNYNIPDPMKHNTAVYVSYKDAKRCYKLSNSKMPGRKKIKSFLSQASTPFKRGVNPWERAELVRFPRTINGFGSKKRRSRKRKSRKKSKKNVKVLKRNVNLVKNLKR